MQKISFRILLATIIFLTSVGSQALANSFFDGIDLHSTWTHSKSFQLTNGTYQESAAPGSASQVIIEATDNTTTGNLVGKAVTLLVLSTETGGSGTFFDLKIFSREGKHLQELSSVFLGDRIKVQELTIEDSVIKITWLGADTGKAMNDKSLSTSKTFALFDHGISELFTVEKPLDVADNRETTTIVDRLWTWKKSSYNNDTSAAPPATQTYSLKLLPDGTLNAQVDCNRGGGKYQQDGNKITINITHTTRAFCADSMDQVFLKDVAEINGFLLKEDKLYLLLKYDTGNMSFE